MLWFGVWVALRGRAIPNDDDEYDDCGGGGAAAAA